MFKPYEGTEPYIFVSYSSDNKHIIYPVLEAMNRVGYRVWYDKGVHLAEEWRKAIAEHVYNCAVLIAFHSTASVKSIHCKREISSACDKGTPILSVFLEDMKLPPELEMYLREVQAISFDGAEKLLNSLDGEPAFEHCRKPRQENSVVPQKPEVPAKTEVPQKPDVPTKTGVPQKPDVPAKQEIPQKPDVPTKQEIPQKPDVPTKTEVPQKPDDVQNNSDTQRKETAKSTPPKDPKKVICSDRSEDIREKRKTNFDMCRVHLKVWSIIALITLALTIVAYYTDEPRVYLAMEDEIRLYFWGGILGCFIAGCVGFAICNDYLRAYAGWERVRNQLSTME